ncbi:hypothetical protein MYCTH_2294653 [Thermothelomyces thermophilus ATCC 42464]|uniref:Uncharacterized protein n=1 Tax=Thermothelomyces thermophilus (strain ATCC 42464 / BCRC 31852 / DSM 1799) TaxID=573729 RepID=G2Q266_THET4|nr:uncharacterized protein MYCTH_2294653 [Thermothelomyces thermophilus ATCC 42464]AEO53393.1 hypothetical protein MYCTH_2294653 [Thermothelomyces thermophilus ATCC 42464]
MFLEFLRGTLQWRPENWKTAKELSDDPWLSSWLATHHCYGVIRVPRSPALASRKV